MIVGKKDHVKISETMKEMLESYPEVVPKLIGVISDMDATQLAANKRLARMLGKIFGVNFKQYFCGMHSAKNSTEYFESLLPIATKATDQAKMLFGTRMTAGNSKYSLKNELQIGLVLETQLKVSPFRTDIGARLGVGYANAKGLIEHRDLVVRVLSIAKARTNEYARRLRRVFKMILAC